MGRSGKTGLSRYERGPGDSAAIIELRAETDESNAALVAAVISLVVALDASHC